MTDQMIHTDEQKHLNELLAATHTGAADYPDVPFGQRDDDRMAFSWAARGLTWLHEQRPAVFADMMIHVVGVELPPAARGRKAG